MRNRIRSSEGQNFICRGFLVAQNGYLHDANCDKEFV